MADLQDLIQKSFEAKTYSHSPYSRFRVGAALETVEGKIFTGCNVENAAYGNCICAEKTAIVKAVSEGYKQFKRIVVSSDLKDEFIVPCGSCRQSIAEFSMDCEVYMTKPDGEYKMMTCRELLPSGFEPSNLKMERINGVKPPHIENGDN